MKSERTKLHPDTDPRKWIGVKYRPPIHLGELADGRDVVLPPYVDDDGVQVHPSRYKKWKEKQNKMKP